MYIVITGIISYFIFFYLVIELYRYTKYRDRLKRYRDDRTYKVGNHEFLNEVKHCFQQELDFRKMIEYLFNGESYRDVTRESIYAFFKINLHATHLDCDVIYNYQAKSGIDNNVDCKDIDNSSDTDRDIGEIVHLIENRISLDTGEEFRFKSDPSRKIKYYVAGRERIRSYFKPIPILVMIKMYRAMIDRYSTWKGYRCIKGDHGIEFLVKKNTRTNSSGNKRYLIFFHGIGFGYAPYIKFVDIFDDYDEIILVDMPNISYSNTYVDRYPTCDEINDAIMRHIGQYHPELLINNKGRLSVHNVLSTSSTLDVCGHSYGSILVSYLMRNRSILNSVKIDRVILLDPVCFLESSYKVTAVSMLRFKEYLKFERDRLFGSIENLWMTIVRAFLYLFVFGDIETQYLMRRTLFIHEMTFPHYLIDRDPDDNDKPRVVVILSDKDIFVDHTIVHNNLKNKPIVMKVLENAIHADMILNGKLHDKIKNFLQDN